MCKHSFLLTKRKATTTKKLIKHKIFIVIYDTDRLFCRALYAMNCYKLINMLCYDSSSRSYDHNMINILCFIRRILC